MLLFNLSALTRSEEIGSVELHFYKRRAVGRKKLAAKPHHHQHHLEGFSLDPSGTPVRRQIGKWQVALEKRGWQVYDVSRAVHSVWKGGQTGDQQLGFMFQGVKRSSGDYEKLHLESVLRMDPSPFLVVFSNELSNATLEETGLVSDLNALPDNADAGQSVTVQPTRPAEEEDEDKEEDEAVMAVESRRRRSIDDNELPEADHYLNSNVIPQTSPGMLQGRSSRHQSAATVAGSRGKISGGQAAATITTTSTSTTTTLPYPKKWDSSGASGGATLAWPEDKKKRTGSNGSGNGGNNSRKGKRRNRKLPETWHYNQQVRRR